MKRRLLITGGAGFIGSSYVRHAIAAHPDWEIAVADALTYAGNLANLDGLIDGARVRFVRADIAEAAQVERLFEERFDVVINLAAETHVDRSIRDPSAFVRTDVLGAFNLLEAARRKPPKLFVQVSTDEVYGSLSEGSAGEQAPLMASSPYAASKAAADRLAYSYFVTYGLPVIVTRPSNTFGPRQHSEKMIPLFITRALLGRPLPVYGDGRQVRDWLHVGDHCGAIDCILERGRPGEVYNIGAGNERANLEVAEAIVDLLGKPRSLIRHVADRPGHDRRYSVDASRIRGLGWQPRRAFTEALGETVDWYARNRTWWGAPLQAQEAERGEPAPAQEEAAGEPAELLRGLDDRSK